MARRELAEAASIRPARSIERLVAPDPTLKLSVLAIIVDKLYIFRRVTARLST